MAAFNDVPFWLVPAEQLDALTEAVEVLEDMYAQRETETEQWFQKWMGELSDHHKTKAALKDAEAKIAELLRLTLAYYRQ